MNSIQHELTYLTKPLPDIEVRLDDKSSQSDEITEQPMLEEKIGANEVPTGRDLNKSVRDYLTQASKMLAPYDIQRKNRQADSMIHKTFGVNVKNFKPVHKRSMSEEGILNIEKMRSEDRENQKELFSNLFEQTAEGKSSPPGPVPNPVVVADQTVEALKTIKSRSGNEATRKQWKNSTGSEEKQVPQEVVPPTSQAPKKTPNRKEGKKRADAAERKKLSQKPMADEMGDKTEGPPTKTKQVNEKRAAKNTSPARSNKSAISNKPGNIPETKKVRQASTKPTEKAPSPIKQPPKDAGKQSPDFPIIKPTIEDTLNCNHI